ncbi:hypothetical protein CLOSTMETH_01271 [[Clostridium] methylpentosum DSM 5476]|uniref:Uncharacterized protein n=1 Tax=[Clostridium] methylpentosum DSM 5476 TaxID=537013 RepID=C0EBQ3_9FIRM|nr:hypothetical protein CLOSTMETH_01271 [[Clostridium] methylpentosum DSM 5476]
MKYSEKSPFIDYFSFFHVAAILIYNWKSRWCINQTGGHQKPYSTLFSQFFPRSTAPVKYRTKADFVFISPQ